LFSNSHNHWQGGCSNTWHVDFYKILSQPPHCPSPSTFLAEIEKYAHIPTNQILSRPMTNLLLG